MGPLAIAHLYLASKISNVVGSYRYDSISKMVENYEL
jgi:hypothetical protein